jgi:hypothetical protein
LKTLAKKKWQASMGILSATCLLNFYSNNIS